MARINFKFESRGCLVLLAIMTLGWTPQDRPGESVADGPPSYGIARRGTATIEDAYRQFLSMAVSHGRVRVAGEVDEMSFEEVTSELESLCIVDSSWNYSPNTCLKRDILAYMTCSYLGCRPGLLTGALGMTRRYAHREMLYQRIIPPGAPATLVSGSELLSVATRVSRRVDQKRDVQLTKDEIH
jgi:hypothetical protein